MELDSLKVIWNNLGEEPAQKDNDEQILSMLRKRSQSPIAKMKRNLHWELIAVLVLYSFTIFYYFTGWSGRYWEVALVLLVVGLIFVFYYYNKSKLLNEMQCVTGEVKTNLKRQLVTLEKYVRFYFISGTVLTPVAYYVSGLIVIAKNPSPSDAIIQSLHDTRGIIIFIIVGIIITCAGYLLNIWYVHKLYGQHIQKLKALVSEMEHDNY